MYKLVNIELRLITRLKRILKVIGLFLLAYIFINLITPYSKFLKNRSINNQINYLSELLDDGYDDVLQDRFPEGKIFSNALLALSIIEHSAKREVLESRSLIVDRCIKRILSSNAKKTFTKDMNPSYGMFYNAWVLLVLSEYSSSELFLHSNIKERVNENKRLINERLVQAQSNAVVELDSYFDASWPADNLIGLIGLEDESLKREWIKVLFENAKHDSGLIHHSGITPNIVRGSSSAMITYALSKGGYGDDKTYNASFKKLLIDDYLGIQFVKEHENGVSVSDVDSGPVVFGYGASATIMNVKTQAILGEPKAKNTWALMNVIGVPINVCGNKFYLFKREPMFDLFMLWGSVSL
jgi:hypothetical protein